MSHGRNDERTVFRHRSSIKGDQYGIEDEGKKYGNFHSLEQPDIDALDILPTCQGCETCKSHKTDESIDLNACAPRPVLVDDSINDESKTIEEIDKRRERQT
jgi:hypothetical protein